jgi:hypothetical protein
MRYRPVERKSTGLISLFVKTNQSYDESLNL